VEQEKRKQAACWLLIGVVILLGASPAMAQEPAAGEEAAGYEDVLSGFDDSDASGLDSEPLPEETDQGRPRWHLGGDLTLSSIWNVSHEAPDPGEIDHRGLSRLRAELNLELEADLFESWRGYISGRGFYDGAYEIQGRDEYPHQVLDEYEDEVEFRETYIQGSPLPNLDLTVGRQIIVWGNTENFRVTDVLNPEDNRVPGLIDIEDMRLPVCAAKADLYWSDAVGRYGLSLIAIPELRYNKEPVFGSDFYPLDTPRPDDNLPSQNLENTEVALALTGIFHNWDLSLYGAYYYENTKRIELEEINYVPVTLPGGLPSLQPVPVFEMAPSRIGMVGLSLNYALGSWLLKSELAWSKGYEYVYAADKKSRLDGLVGFEYTGLTNTTLTLECQQTYMPDFKDEMRQAPDYAESSSFTTAFRVNQDWMHDRLELMFLAMVMGIEAEDGAFERLSAAYDLSDNLTATVGCVFYQDGEAAAMDNVHDNNRVYLELTRNF